MTKAFKNLMFNIVFEISEMLTCFGQELGPKQLWDPYFRLSPGNSVHTTKFYIKNNADSYCPRSMVTTLCISNFLKTYTCRTICLGPPGMYERLDKGAGFALRRKAIGFGKTLTLKGRERATSGPRQGRKI